MKYYIEEKDYGVLVIDENAKIVFETPSLEEAEQWIEEQTKQDSNVQPVKELNWEERFKKYCNKLPGKSFHDGVLHSTSKQIFSFAEGFEKLNPNIRVIISSVYIGGEEFFKVEEIKEEE